ncbi:hypothetical protein JS756_36310, partial [Streptomyces actuosus]
MTKTENAIAKALSVKRQKTPGKPRYTERPGFGTQGQGEASGKKGKKPAKAGPAPAGKYISVADFFRQGKLLYALKQSYLELTVDDVKHITS